MSKRLLWGMVFLLLCAMPIFAQDSDAGYQEALRRIKEAQMSGTTELDLSWIRLTAVPPEIGQLKTLQKLELWGNQLTALPPEITQLVSLEHLNLKGNQFTVLPPEIIRLTQLQWLSFQSNQLTALPPEIGQLSKLRFLYLTNNPLTTLPIEVGQLSRIVYLHASPLTFPPPEIQRQGAQVMVAYLRDYKAMLIRQTIAGIAAGVGAISGLTLAFRWRQRRGLNEPSEKKKRL